MVVTYNRFECEKCKYTFPSKEAAEKHEGLCIHRGRKDWAGKIIKMGPDVEVIGGQLGIEGRKKGYKTIWARNEDDNISIVFCEVEGDYEWYRRVCPDAEEISYDELKAFINKIKASFANTIDDIVASVSATEDSQ